MEAGSLVLSQNVKNQAEIVVKDLMPYGAPTTLIGLEDEIGIVKFLRGKKFFITGATGFLAKGIYVKYNHLWDNMLRIFRVFSGLIALTMIYSDIVFALIQFLLRRF